MLRRPFTAPFYAMIIFGVLSAAMDLNVLYFKLGFTLPRQTDSDRVINLVMPIFFSLEAWFYWRARKINIYKIISWTQIILLALAFLMPLAEELSWYLYRGQLNNQDTTRYLFNVFIATRLGFMLLLFVAHFLFLLVLIKVQARAKELKRPVRMDPGNILDDVLR